MNLNNSIFQYWWRTSDDDADEESHLKLDLSDISKLTPRLKLCRKLERLALISQEGLDDLRHKLISYRAGDFWLPVGGIKKEDMDIPPRGDSAHGLGVSTMYRTSNEKWIL